MIKKLFTLRGNIAANLKNFLTAMLMEYFLYNFLNALVTKNYHLEIK